MHWLGPRQAGREPATEDRDKCRRGLLCLKCNTGLGYVERMTALARTYLDKISAVPVVW